RPSGGASGATSGGTATAAASTGSRLCRAPWEEKLSSLSRKLCTAEERNTLFATFKPLGDDARTKLVVEAGRRRIQDPQMLRRMAVDAVLSSAQTRRLLRDVESAIGSVRGSGGNEDGV